jgi:hypothetical protein
VIDPGECAPLENQRQTAEYTVLLIDRATCPSVFAGELLYRLLCFLVNCQSTPLSNDFSGVSAIQHIEMATLL